ncbi:YbjN domain-containing protein [Actinocorallia sp. A-T 12471]|uniref:YbjN domain-containing protein n=1 Tax=Actinocorallia sp. A-T 12471 TaxID=3089813 RepID=UPI0029D2DDC5|nr:YbjN domain-containing protein [Actinocorallia sp. A-T 12471]MDX6745001.1 YbjN domain-containing protein [Actinocorallia sp. A-T 12471]
MSNTETNSLAANAIETIRGALEEVELTYEEPRDGAFLIRLPGEHKLATMVWFIVGTYSLHVEAFFCRKPDENHAVFYRWLLEKNSKMYGLAFTLDEVGDVYLVGKTPLKAVDADEVDRLLGSALSYSDENFDRALELGFKTSIQKEWDWRVSRGESLANLQAFARFAAPGNR